MTPCLGLLTFGLLHTRPGLQARRGPLQVQVSEDRAGPPGTRLEGAQPDSAAIRFSLRHVASLIPSCAFLHPQKELHAKKDCPHMCAYKLVTVKFKWWGLQNKVENFIQKVSLLLLTRWFR